MMLMVMMMTVVMMMTERTEQLLVSNRQTTFDRQLDAAQLGRFGSQVNLLIFIPMLKMTGPKVTDFLVMTKERFRQLYWRS